MLRDFRAGVLEAREEAKQAAERLRILAQQTDVAAGTPTGRCPTPLVHDPAASALVVPLTLRPTLSQALAIRREARALAAAHALESDEQTQSLEPDFGTAVRIAASGELETRAALERLLGVPFAKARPAWLRNHSTGRNLECDCLNESLRLCIEYQGIQHYVYPNPFHKSREEFSAQKQRDRLKHALCKAEGVTLVEVPYTVKRQDIQAFLSAELHKVRPDLHVHK